VVPRRGAAAHGARFGRIDQADAGILMRFAADEFQILATPLVGESAR